MDDKPSSETGRFFFGLEIKAAWPEELPPGRLIAEKERHLTLAFLGTQKRESIKFPPPPFTLAPAGIFNDCLFLSNCVAWHVDWQTEKESLLNYQKELASLAKPEKHPFTPHVTIARAPFNPKLWKRNFQQAPLFASAICLFESLGHSTYRTVERHGLLEPIVEIEHTADLAFLIRARSFHELYLNALLALSFLFTPLIAYGREEMSLLSLDDVIIALNRAIAITDYTQGCPLKAVSFHSQLSNVRPEIMEWEMIVDV